MTAYTVLVTGVGSLVGKAVLDALEGRRANLYVVGTSFGVEAPSVYRCDEAFLTAPSDAPEFADQLQAVIARVRPDLVIPARDPDVSVVANLDVASVTGSPGAARVCSDKWRTYEFAQEHGLPIIETALAGAAGFAAPAIAKPRTGSGSVGVRLLLNDAAWCRAQQLEDYVLQPLIGQVPDAIEPDDGIPLFWSMQTGREGGVQGVIEPDGAVGIATAFETTKQFGWVRSQWLSDDDELTSVGMNWLSALARAGWRGPLNVSCVHDGRSWVLMELNPRFTGGTAARTMCGFDEVGFTLNRWAGRDIVPPLDDLRASAATTVVREMVEYPLFASDMTQLAGGHWVRAR